MESNKGPTSEVFDEEKFDEENSWRAFDRGEGLADSELVALQQEASLLLGSLHARGERYKLITDLVNADYVRLTDMVQKRGLL